MGFNRYYQGDYEPALKYYQESYERLISAVPAREGATAFVLNYIGSIFKICGQYDAALDYFQRGLKISENYSNYYMVASILENMETIYRIKDSMRSENIPGNPIKYRRFRYWKYRRCESFSDIHRRAPVHLIDPCE